MVQTKEPQAPAPAGGRSGSGQARSEASTAVPSVTDLVLAARAKDQSAFTSLFLEYKVYAWAVAIRTTSNRALAEDAVIDEFAATFRALDRIENPEAFRSYLATTVRRMAMAPGRKNREVAQPEPAADLMATAPGPEETYDIDIDAKAPLEAFQRLDDRQRNAVYLVDVEGSSSNEAAVTMGLTSVAFRQLLSRARKNMRLNFIAPSLGEDAPGPCRSCNDNLAAFIRGSAGTRVVDLVETHVAGCVGCQERLEMAPETNSLLTKAGAAVPAGISAGLLARYGIDVRSGGPTRPKGRYARHLRRGWGHVAGMSHTVHLGIALAHVAVSVGVVAGYHSMAATRPAALVTPSPPERTVPGNLAGQNPLATPTSTTNPSVTAPIVALHRAVVHNSGLVHPKPTAIVSVTPPSL